MVLQITRYFSTLLITNDIVNDTNNGKNTRKKCSDVSSSRC